MISSAQPSFPAPAPHLRSKKPSGTARKRSTTTSPLSLLVSPLFFFSAAFRALLLIVSHGSYFFPPVPHAPGVFPDAYNLSLRFPLSFLLLRLKNAPPPPSPPPVFSPLPVSPFNRSRLHYLKNFPPSSLPRNPLVNNRFTPFPLQRRKSSSGSLVVVFSGAG